MSKQIKTDIDVIYKKRNRATVFWRGILALPVFIFLASFAEGMNWGWATGLIVLPTVLTLVVRGIYPSYVFAFNHALLELQTRIFAYILLLTDEYPSIEASKNVTVTFPDVEGGKKLNRWLPLVKWILAIPLFFVGIIYSAIALVMTFFAWIITSATGKYPKWAGKFVSGTIKFWNRVDGYCLVLVSDKYPSFKL